MVVLDCQNNQKQNMLLNYSHRKLTPIKMNRTPLKHEPKPEFFTFNSNRVKKLPPNELSDASALKVADPRRLNSCKNSSQKQLGLNKIYRVFLTPDKPLQFGRKNSGIKKFPQNIFKNIHFVENIKRAPLAFVDMNNRRQTIKPNRTPERHQLKTRSISHSPIAFKNKFSRKESKNCPQEFGQLKQQSLVSLPKIPSLSTSPGLKSKSDSGRVSLKVTDFSKGKLLGKGYFGEVFIVRHKLTGFICALKTLSKEKIKAEKVQESLLREIKIHSFMDHENVINMYGVLQDETNVYILQELASDSIYNVLTKHKSLSESQAIPFLKETLKGLQYLHYHHVMHRDIKPENLLISYDGKVKICDFGWAVYQPLGMRKSNIGTLLYLSPENIIGKGYDHRHDIWAVGVMSYQLLTGSIPFNIWVEEQKSKIVTDDIHFPEYIEVPKRAQAFVFRMLQKQPSKRASISSLLQDSFLLGTEK